MSAEKHTDQNIKAVADDIQASRTAIGGPSSGEASQMLKNGKFMLVSIENFVDNRSS